MYLRFIGENKWPRYTHVLSVQVNLKQNTNQQILTDHFAHAHAQYLLITKIAQLSLYVSVGNKKDYEAIQCQKCKNKETLLNIESKPISDYMLKESASRALYNNVRKIARRKMIIENIEYKCIICEFPYPEVCHIKPLAQFDETALMGEVNHINNLVYLCPNHHLLLDKYQDEFVINAVNKLVLAAGFEPAR